MMMMSLISLAEAVLVAVIMSHFLAAGFSKAKLAVVKVK
jgi:hypothetical protein